MADYPDYTTLMQILGSDIMLPIDIQGAYIQMPVDIQGQYVTLDIDIVAQSVGNLTIDIAAQSLGNLDINIAASAVTLNVAIQSSAVTLDVDITAQTIDNLKININAQDIGVYLQPEWSAKTGVDKNLTGVATISSGFLTTILEYTVTSGKTFYISTWGFNMLASAGIMAILTKVVDATETVIFCSGGQTGNAHSLNKPITVPGGGKVRVKCEQFTGGDVMVRASVGGYEI